MDVENRIQNASCAFGCLRKPLFSNPAISKPTKRAVYKALVLSILLYGTETWCLTETLVVLLRVFHNRCIRVNLSHAYEHKLSMEELFRKTYKFCGSAEPRNFLPLTL